MTSELAEKIDQKDVEKAADKDQKDYWRTLLEKQVKQYGLALQGSDGKPLIDPNKFTRVALTAIRNNEKLQQADVMSLLGAVMGAAQLGLEPHGPLEHTYLVPYGKEVQLIIGYKGLEQLAYRSGIVSSINARVVREGDEFSFEYGTNEYLSHKPKGGHGGEPTNAYAIAKLVTGGTVMVVLFPSDWERIRERSASGKKGQGPWKTDTDQMIRKSAIRQLFKDLPASVETQRALGYDERTFHEIPEVDEFIDVEAVDDEEQV